MKILMLTPYLPYPLYSGGQIRSYNLLKKLSKKHEITLFSFIRNEEENKFKKELLKFCRQIKTIKRRPAWSLLHILLAAITPYPFLLILTYFMPSLRREIKKELDGGKYDLIHVETFYVLPNVPKTNAPVLLVEQTIEYRVYLHFVKNQPLILRLLLLVDVWKLKFWEKHYWKKANQVVAVSYADKEVMEREVSGLNVAIIPNGVDTAHFSEVHRKERGKTVLFVGNFKWLQNREAVLLLINSIWPRIKLRIPKAKLWIVGKNIPAEIERKREKDIQVNSDIDDIRNAYSHADVLLVPIKGPGGTRYKILEAMASGLPVVTTPNGIEGLGAKDGFSVLVRKTINGLVEATIEVLRDQKLSSFLSQNGRIFVGQNYDWKKIAQNLDGLYKKVAGLKNQD